MKRRAFITLVGGALRSAGRSNAPAWARQRECIDQLADISCLAQMLAPVRGNQNVERLPRLGHVSDIGGSWRS
jgi:hypothetical protein